MGRFPLITGFLIMLSVQACSYLKGDASISNNRSVHVIGDIRHVHDPCMVHNGDTFFLFSTGKGIPIRTSRDMKHWVTAGVVFNAMPLGSPPCFQEGAMYGLRTYPISVVNIISITQFPPLEATVPLSDWQPIKPWMETILNIDGWIRGLCLHPKTRMIGTRLIPIYVLMRMEILGFRLGVSGAV